MPEDKKALLGETTQINQLFEQLVYLPVHNLIPQDDFEVIIKRVVGISHRY